jgi:hypothetical protein
MNSVLSVDGEVYEKGSLSGKDLLYHIYSPVFRCHQKSRPELWYENIIIDRINIANNLKKDIQNIYFFSSA